MWTAARMRLDKWTCRPPAARKLKIDSVDRKIDAAQPPPKQSLFSADRSIVYLIEFLCI